MSSQLLKQSASGGASDVLVPNDLVVAGQLSVNNYLKGPQTLTLNGRYIQIGGTSTQQQTPPDGTQGANNYWEIVWGGQEIQCVVNDSATSATSVLIVVVPADFVTNNAAYVQKKIGTFYANIQSSSTVTLQVHIGSATGQQIAVQRLDPQGSIKTFRVDLCVGCPYGITSGQTDNWFGIFTYTIIQPGIGWAFLPPT